MAPDCMCAACCGGRDKQELENEMISLKAVNGEVLLREHLNPAQWADYEATREFNFRLDVTEVAGYAPRGIYRVSGHHQYRSLAMPPIGGAVYAKNMWVLVSGKGPLGEHDGAANALAIMLGAKATYGHLLVGYCHDQTPAALERRRREMNDYNGTI